MQKFDITKAITQSPFFLGEMANVKIESQTLSEIWIGEFSFSVRFNNVLKHNKEISSIQDLLNTDYSKLLRQPNCGLKTIADSRHVIMEYFDIDEPNDFPLHIVLNLKNKPGFQNRNTSRHISDNLHLVIEEKLVEESFISTMDKGKLEKKLLTDLNLIGFGVRFKAALKSFPSCKTIGDVINLRVADFLELENVGSKSVKDARQIIIEFLKSEDIDKVSFSDRLDERIVQKLNFSVKKDNFVKVFLAYYEYMRTDKKSLEEIGAESGVTRERIRQKIAKVSEEINRNSFILQDLVNSLKEFGYIFKLESFYQYLVQENKWNEKNKRFLCNLIKDFISGKNNIILSKQFIMTEDESSLTNVLQEINKLTCEFLKTDRNGVQIHEALEHLSNEFGYNRSTEIDIGKILTTDVLEFFSESYQDFFVKDSIVYNEMIFQVRFGKRLDKVIVNTLKFLGEPIHFMQLAAFIRETNENHTEVSNDSVHSTLQNEEETIIVDAGTYSCKGDNVKEYKSTPVSIFELLKKHGPLTESQIIKRLPEIEINTVKITLRNHTNKHFIRVGNDLYDIKNDNGNDWN